MFVEKYLLYKLDFPKFRNENRQIKNKQFFYNLLFEKKLNFIIHINLRMADFIYNFYDFNHNDKMKNDLY